MPRHHRADGVDVAVLSERARLAELAAYAVVDSAPDLAFGDIVEVAAEAAGCPTALVSLLDEDRQWFLARSGLDATQTPRSMAFCEHVLRADAPLVVPDATADPRFVDNPLVTGSPHIRFYAGYPLRTPTGAVLGTLCVLDYTARPEGLTPAQDRMLTVLATQVMAQLELRRALAVQGETMADRETALASYRALADHATDVVSRHLLDGTTLYVSPSIQQVLGCDPAREVGQAAPDRIHPDDVPTMMACLIAVAGGASMTASVRSRHADGTWRHLEIRLSPIRDDTGTVVQVHSVARDATDRDVAQRQLLDMAVELTDARDEAVRRHALSEAVLHTVGVGIVACDAEGHLTIFNGVTRRLHGMPADPELDPADWADRYALYAEDGVTVLTRDEVPLFRALTEGVVEDVLIVIAPEGHPARTLQCQGRAMRDEHGRVLGAVVAMTDVTDSREAARVLAEQAQSTHILLENAHAAIWSFDASGRPTFINPAARAVLGVLDLDALQRLYDEGELARLTSAVTLLRPDGTPVEVDDRPLARALRGQRTEEVELLLVVEGQPQRTVLMQATPLRDAAGEVSGAMLTGYDVTALRASEARFRAAFHDGPTSVARLDADGVVLEVNPALRRLTSLRDHQIVGHLLADHVLAEDRPRLARVLTGSGTGADPAEVRLVRADGKPFWCELATTLSVDPDGGAWVLAQFLDVDARKRQERTLERAVGRDPLTGLANRSELRTLGRQALSDRRAGTTTGVLFLDLDGFKAVNDRYGHDAGDAVLVEVARRLSATVRPSDIVVRLGGDEFLIVCSLPAHQPDQVLSRLAARLGSATASAIAFKGGEVSVGMSVGRAVAQSGQSLEDLVEAADKAMYEHKRRRRPVVAQ